MGRTAAGLKSFGPLGKAFLWFHDIQIRIGVS
jgi:hypothetical protein